VAFAFVDSDGNVGVPTGTTLDCVGTLNVAAGDLLVAWTKWEEGASTVAVSDGGSNAFTMESVVNSGGGPYGAFGYKIAASANASAMFRMTLGTSREYRTLLVMLFRPDSGETVTRDAANTGTGNSTSGLSGNITTTGDDEVVCGGYSEYSTTNTSAEQIGDVNATAVLRTNTLYGGNFSSMWYRILSATASDIHAQCTGGNDKWVCNIIAFKSAAAGGATPINATPSDNFNPTDAVSGQHNFRASFGDNLEN
jgi:hypothetical protein